MNEKTHLLIINPAAGRGRTGKLIPLMKSRLQERHIACEFRYTSRPGEATQIAIEAVSMGFTNIVSVGGDGTAHEILNGIMGSSATLGMIPTGGGNDFPKAAGIPLDMEKAIEMLAGGFSRRFDVGLLGGRYFMNGLGIGLDGAVSHRYRQMKLLRGELGYLWGAVLEAFTFKGFRVEIALPGWSYEGRVLLTGASNGPSQGGDFRIAPEAKADDGLLDIHVIRDMPPIRRLVQISKVREGKHLSLQEVEIKRAPWMEIKIDEKIPAHLDGEPFFLDPGKHRIEVVPKALEVISGKGDTPT